MLSANQKRDGEFNVFYTFNKQLLDEVEHDIMNYQNRGA